MKNNTLNARCELHNTCDSLLSKCNTDMTKLINDFNDDMNNETFVDTVDLDSKFTNLADYVEEYTFSDPN